MTVAAINVAGGRVLTSPFPVTFEFALSLRARAAESEVTNGLSANVGSRGRHPAAADPVLGAVRYGAGL